MNDQQKPVATIIFLDDDTPDTPEFAALRKEIMDEFEALLFSDDED